MATGIPSSDVFSVVHRQFFLQDSARALRPFRCRIFCLIKDFEAPQQHHSLADQLAALEGQEDCIMFRTWSLYKLSALCCAEGGKVGETCQTLFSAGIGLLGSPRAL